MKMDHFVLGLVFNQAKDRVLLIEKNRPAWMAGKWNGIGGHIEENETPLQAMNREAIEECGQSYVFEHKITFTCPGGTVYVFAAIYHNYIVDYIQIEDEQLNMWTLPGPQENMMDILKWIIPLCLSTVQFPVTLQQNELGVNDITKIKENTTSKDSCESCADTVCGYAGQKGTTCERFKDNRNYPINQDTDEERKILEDRENPPAPAQKACCGNCAERLKLKGCSRYVKTHDDGCCIDHKFLKWEGKP